MNKNGIILLLHAMGLDEARMKMILPDSETQRGDKARLEMLKSWLLQSTTKMAYSRKTPNKSYSELSNEAKTVADTLFRDDRLNWLKSYFGFKVIAPSKGAKQLKQVIERNEFELRDVLRSELLKVLEKYS